MANPNAHAIALAAANEALRMELADAKAEIDRLRALNAEHAAVREALAAARGPQPPDTDLAGWIAYKMREWDSERAEASHLAMLCQQAHDALTVLGVPFGGTPAERIARIGPAEECREATCPSPAVCEQTHGAVDIEAVFAGTAPAPEGWKQTNFADGTRRLARWIRVNPVVIWSTGMVQIFPGVAGCKSEVYPTLTRAWEVAQDIARRLDAGEDVTKLPPAEPTPISAVWPFLPSDPSARSLTLEERLKAAEDTLTYILPRLSAMEQRVRGAQ